MPIEQHAVGASELVVPALGIGTWSWGDARFWGYGRTHTRDDVLQAYRTCLDAGFNFFDTAAIYGDGESERLLGEFYRTDGRPILIATKFAAPPLALPGVRFSPKTLHTSLDNSLRRLGVERIDLYQIHMPPPTHRLEALMNALAESVRAGKVRAVGVSNFTAALMRQAHKVLAQSSIPLASNQVHYNLLHRYPETNGVLDACRELNVALIAYSPLEQGMLSGKYRMGTATRPVIQRVLRGIGGRVDPFGDTKESVPTVQRLFSGFRTLRREKVEPLFQVLDEIATAHEKTLSQVALNWLLSQDPRVIPIPGAKNARQARENSGALGWRLTPAECNRISQAEISMR